MRELSLKKKSGWVHERASASVCVCAKLKKTDGQTELGRGLVLVELVLPFGARERRQDAGDGPPLGDAQPGLGETGDATDDDDGEDENGGEQEPVPDRGCGDHGKVLVVSLR